MMWHFPDRWTRSETLMFPSNEGVEMGISAMDIIDVILQAVFWSHICEIKERYVAFCKKADGGGLMVRDDDMMMMI